MVLSILESLKARRRLQGYVGVSMRKACVHSLCEAVRLLCSLQSDMWFVTRMRCFTELARRSHTFCLLALTCQVAMPPPRVAAIQPTREVCLCQVVVPPTLEDDLTQRIQMW